MGQVVLKTARDRGQYVIWSSVVDTIVAGPGTREETADYLLNTGRIRYTADEVEEIMARVDTNGSSDRNVRFGWWDDEDLSVVTGSPPDGWYHLPRGRLPEFAEALDRDDDQAAQDLLVCWQRFDEEDG